MQPMDSPRMTGVFFVTLPAELRKLQRGTRATFSSVLVRCLWGGRSAVDYKSLVRKRQPCVAGGTPVVGALIWMGKEGAKQSLSFLSWDSEYLRGRENLLAVVGKGFINCLLLLWGEVPHTWTTLSVTRRVTVRHSINTIMSLNSSVPLCEM